MAILILVFSHFLAILIEKILQLLGVQPQTPLTRTQYSCCPPCISGLVIAFCTRVECNPWSVHACTHSHCIHAIYSFLGIDWALFYLPEWLPRDTYNCIVLLPYHGVVITKQILGSCTPWDWEFIWQTMVIVFRGAGFFYDIPVVSIIPFSKICLVSMVMKVWQHDS